MKKAVFKFNGGKLALLCSKCGVIIKTGKYFTKSEKHAAIGEKSIPAQYCDKCK